MWSHEFLQRGGDGLIKYILKFSKEGKIKYVSHLDTMRIFKRAFRRASISLLYSKGYNPHPRISIAQPLSLGFESTGEYLEFETDMNYEISYIGKRLSCTLPSGIAVLDCRKVDRKKSVSSLVSWASYEISYNNGCIDMDLDSFMKKEHIFVNKKSKSGRDIRIDIRPLIFEFKIIGNEKRLKFSVIIRAGGDAYLNPIMLLKAIFDYNDKHFDDVYASIKRLDLFDMDMTPLMYL